MILKPGLQYCQQHLAKELHLKNCQTSDSLQKQGIIILQESEWGIKEHFTVQGISEVGRWGGGGSKYTGYHNSLLIAPYFLALLIGSIWCKLVTIQMLIVRGRTANKILFPFNSADVPGVSRPIDLCDFDAEISFKDTELCVSTGFCCMIYMGFFLQIKLYIYVWDSCTCTCAMFSQTIGDFCVYWSLF